jgi:hypothetical protein
VIAVFFSLLASGNERSDVMAGTPTAAREGHEVAVGTKIRLKVGEKVLSATLIDSETTRDLVSLLPLTLTMNDLFRREKFAHLPRAIAQGGKRTHTYEVGNIAYWSPGPDVAIFYRHDGPEIPDPGIIVIGKVASGLEALNVPGSVRITIEPIQ